MQFLLHRNGVEISLNAINFNRNSKIPLQLTKIMDRVKNV